MIEVLIEAIKSVPEHYYTIQNPKRKNGHIIDYTDEYVFPERNYCTNLYHQMLLKIESIIPDIGEQYFLDEEIYKKFTGCYLNDPFFTNTYNELSIIKNGMRPDLILHKSQKSRDCTNQLLILECKIDPDLNQNDFNKDVFKLNIYKSELNYQNSVYVIANNNIRKIESFIEEYRKKYWVSGKGQIEILIIEKHGEEVKKRHLTNASTL